MKDQTANDVVGKGPTQALASASSLLSQFHKGGTVTYRSGDTDGKSPLLASVVWIRNEATPFVSIKQPSQAIHPTSQDLPVRTNCPTVAENPDKKALNGCPRPPD